MKKSLEYSTAETSQNADKAEIVAYQAEGELHVDVRLEYETVWLTQAQMALLFT